MPRGQLLVAVAAAGFLLACTMLLIVLPAGHAWRGPVFVADLAGLAVMFAAATRPRGGWRAYWRDCPLWSRSQDDK